MIGFIALAGIIVRNSILLVDFIRHRQREGHSLRDCLIEAGAVRFKPIVLTAAAAMIGAAFILTDPIFQGLAISLVFGLASSTALTVLVVPAIYVVLRDDGRPFGQGFRPATHEIGARRHRPPAAWLRAVNDGRLGTPVAAKGWGQGRIAGRGLAPWLAAGPAAPMIEGTWKRWNAFRNMARRGLWRRKPRGGDAAIEVRRSINLTQLSILGHHRRRPHRRRGRSLPGAGGRHPQSVLLRPAEFLLRSQPAYGAGAARPPHHLSPVIGGSWWCFSCALCRRNAAARASRMSSTRSTTARARSGPGRLP